MLRFKIYDKEKKEEKMWISSSSIYFTRMVEDPSDNKGNLYVTFNNGTTYLYKNVSFQDYVLLVGGGTDVSQGKTLNKLIKPKYEYEKLENGPTIQEIDNELKELQTPKKDTYDKPFNDAWKDIRDSLQSSIEFMNSFPSSHKDFQEDKITKDNIGEVLLNIKNEINAILNKYEINFPF